MSLPFATPELRKGEARASFLNAVERLYPEVVISLRDNILPSYNGERPEWRYIRKDTRLHNSLLAWGETFHLDYPWVYDEALRTLNVARQWGKWAEMNPIRWLGFDIGGGWEPSLDDLSLTPNPATETLEQFLARATKSYKQAAERFEDAGFSEDSRRELSKHLEWLARYIVKGESQKQIADSSDTPVGEDAVGKAIRATAKLIEIQLPTKKGRPRNPT